MNKNVAFLHIGDIHFDSKYLGLDESKRAVRQLETQMTLKRVIGENDDAKIILFAGDLFDGEFNLLTITFLCKLFSENPDKRFFISCGNHDYLNSKSMKTLFSEKPSNVHIFDDSITFVDLEQYGVRVYGASFVKPHSFSDMLADFNAENPHLVNIMLMHGDLDNSSQYNPIDISKIGKSNLDYLALGHRHSFSGIKQSGKTLYTYPGILEPRGFDECGKCGVVKGYINDGVITAEFLPCSMREYAIIETDITNLTTDIEIIEKINSIIKSQNIYRIILTGHRTLASTNLSLYEEMADAFYCEIEDKSTNPINILDFSEENSLIGKTASILKKYMDDNVYDKEILQDVSDTLSELLCMDGK